jgi:toxin-antitoxin system PIN domain toxin
MKPALLDVNILIALIDPAHEFHLPAHVWFRRNRRHGWATCPFTENGCVRIMSKPGYPFPGLTAERVQGILIELTRVAGHIFWPDSLSVLDKSTFRLAGAGPRNITDIYLVGLAVANGARLATFDRSITADHVIGGEPGAIELIAP